MNFDQAIKRFDAVVTEELDRNISPGYSVAWIVDGKAVLAKGYGFADRSSSAPATKDTIYRAGSISKLFNAIGAVRLVEDGKLDLDAPIQQALPSFRIINPFEPADPITVRQLLCHRSGMIREAPVGGYLDPSQPTIAQTVESVASTVLVNPPNTRTRYSNVGPTIVGHAVETIEGRPFEKVQQERVLGPLGMSSSAWTMNDELRPRLAKAVMRVVQGDGSFDIEEAPEFELGTIPAGNLYTSAVDLATFAAFLMSIDDEGGPTPAILRKESLEEMFKPQLVETTVGFGLGFVVGRFREHKVVAHSGAVYGFSTSLTVLPEVNIGVVVLSNSDISSGPVRRLVDASLELLAEVVLGEEPSREPPEIMLEKADLASFTGEYESESFWATISVNDGKLTGNLSSQPIALTPIEPLKFVAESRVMHRAPLEFHRGDDGTITGFHLAGQRFNRLDSSSDEPVPPEWQSFVGRYGPAFIPLRVSVRHNHLYALAENEYDYRLSPINRVTFLMPPGMYAEEHLVFQEDPKGNVLSVIFANQTLPRRPD